VVQAGGVWVLDLRRKAFQLLPTQYTASNAFPNSYGAGITISNYDVTADGQRFVMVKDEDNVSRIRVVLDWRPDAARVP
jgi:hypothetical protein